jgi:hypothetical protein
LISRLVKFLSPSAGPLVYQETGSDFLLPWSCVSILGELCRIIRYLGSGMMLAGEPSGLLTHIATTETVSSFGPMKS